MTEWQSSYIRRVNAERLARQAEDVKRPAKEILNSLKSIEQYLYWALDPDEKDGGAYYTLRAIEHAHTLIDLAHDYRAAVKANPPPKEEPEDDESAAQALDKHSTNT